MEDLGAVATVEPSITPSAPAADTTGSTTTETPGGTPADGGGAPPEPLGGGEQPAADEGAEGGLGGAEEEEVDLAGGSGAPSAAELATRKAISELKKTNPEAAKAWAKDHYEKGAYQKEFPTVQEARSARATIDSLGGEEGINSLQEEIGDYRREIEQFSQGDPALLNDLYESNPQGLSLSVQNALQLLGEKNPDLFDQALIPSMSARMESGNIYSVTDGVAKAFEALEGLIKEGNGQGAFDLLQKIKTSHKSVNDWMGRLKDMAGKAGEKVAKRDPEREAFEKERSEFAATKAKEHFEKIGTDVNQLNNSVTQKLVDPFFKSMKLSTEGRKAFVDQLYSRIFAAIKADKTFKRQESAVRARGNVKESAEFIHAKFASLLPEHFRKLRNSLYPNWKPTNGAVPPPKTPATPTPGGNVQSGATVTLQQARDVGIDFSKTSQLDWIKGTNVTLKNGKVVTVDRSK